jgi:hypothetical protein
MEAWLALMDTGEYARSWEVAASYFQRSISKEEWVARLEKIRRPLGEVLSRKPVSIKQTVAGTRYEAIHESSFDGLLAATETVTYAKQPSGEWKPIVYLIHPAGNVIGHALQKCLLRLALLVAASLALTEVAIQISGHWRESDQEQWFVPFAFAALAGSVWAVWCFFRAPRSFGKLLVGIAGVFVSFLTVWVAGDLYGNFVVPRFVHPEMREEIDISFGRGQASTSLAKQHATKTPAGMTQNFSFGPVIERQLSQNTQRDVCFIDLDGNKVFAPPRPDLSSEELDAWITRNGIDAIAITKVRQAGDMQGLLGWNMRLLQVGPDNWQKLTPAELAAQLESVQPMREVMLRGENALPATFLFETGASNMGVLQITGFTENPRAVKIRYKLVQTEKKESG